jgi:hypothetical protein
MDENDWRPVPNPREGDLHTVGADDLHDRNLQARFGAVASVRDTIGPASLVDGAGATNDPQGRLPEFRIGTDAAPVTSNRDNSPERRAAAPPSWPLQA